MVKKSKFRQFDNVNSKGYNDPVNTPNSPLNFSHVAGEKKYLLLLNCTGDSIAKTSSDIGNKIFNAKIPCQFTEMCNDFFHCNLRKV